jgi:phosphatidylglycerophosphate synthase
MSSAAATSTAALNISATYKAPEVEGLLDIHLYRKVGFRLAHLFARWRITPAGVTLVGTAVGVLAGHLYFYQSLAINLLGFALHILCNALDNADGQLARLTNKGSREGRFLDGLGDFVVFGSVYLHLSLRYTASGGSSFIWLLALAGAFSHSLQTSLADYLRNAFVYFVSGGRGGEFDTSERLRREYDGLSWRKEPWRKLYLRLYLNYTLQQERLLPRLREVRSVIDQHVRQAGGRWLTERYRRENRMLVRCANFFGRNTRMFFLLVILLAGRPAWFFILDLSLFNLLLVAILFWQDEVFDRLLDIASRVPRASIA